MSFPTAPEPKTELGRYRFLSPTCGLRVSPLQLGAMSIGEAWKDMMGSMNKESSFKLLDFYYESGGNFIDTANNYQNEESELWIGEWMASRKNRDEMVIATKFTTGYKAYDQSVKINANYFGNHNKSMVHSIDASLKKLQTSYVDILYLHWWDHTTGVEEIMQGLNRLVQQGKVLYLGISDTPAWIVSKANQYARDHGLAQFVIYQGRWNAMLRDFEREILPMARAEGMALAPWDAIGGGKFQTKAQLAEREKAGEGLRNMLGSDKQDEQQVKVSAALEVVAKEVGAESITAVALAYVMQKAPHVFPIVGGRKVEHLKQNIQSLTFTLTDEHIKTIEEATPFDVGFPSNFVGADPAVTGGDSFFLTAMNGHFSYNTKTQPIHPHPNAKK